MATRTTPPADKKEPATKAVTRKVATVATPAKTAPVSATKASVKKTVATVPAKSPAQSKDAQEKVSKPRANAATQAPKAPKAPAKTASRKTIAARPALLLYQVPGTGKPTVDALCTPCELPAGTNLPLIDGMRLLQQDQKNQSAALWGLLPADFAQRTGLSVEAFKTEIEAHPGFDVYFCHAHPELEAIYHNAWLQAEVSHPKFLLLAREFLKAAGLPDAPLDTLTHSANFATGHLMVATPAFWAQYLDFIQHSVAKAKAGMGKTARAALFGEPLKAEKFTYLYLIVARMLGLMITAKTSSLKAYKVALPQEQSLNPHLRLLREMRDTAVSRQSRWQVACWSNYRALYLAQSQGKTWLTQHLAAISPKALRLGQPVNHVTYAYAPTVEGAGK